VKTGEIDPTLPAAQTEASTSSGRGLVPSALESPGYDLRGTIGRGGMGEGVLAQDRRIGRVVAIKRMLAAAPDDEAIARFLREAKIQARLDHPAIVPVYELGHDGEGRPYFTMKRLSGVTLAALLAESAGSQRLLRALAEVCLAIELAHTRGIVHRDLKPANIMLGDFGEVYVLDWGVARVLGDAEAGSGVGDPTLDGATEAGVVLGTPAYMAPEQLRGEPVGPAADVYALGCVLFEILAGEPLHPRAKPRGDVETHPARRRRDRAIAPELDALCAEALAADPAARPTARALGERIQRYLDGDRDLERRRTLAAEQVAAARAALASADPGARADAMQAAGRALALDPESRDAAALVGKLMLEPPDQLPGELEHDLEELDRGFAKRQWRTVVLAYGCYFPFLPIMIWQGITSWGLVLLLYGLVAFNLVHAAVNARTTSSHIALAFTVNVVELMVLTRLLGPFLVVPGVIGATASTWLTYPALARRPWLPISAMVAVLGVPIALEALGVLRATWHVAHHAIVSTSAVLALGGPATTVLLVGSALGTVLITGWLARTLALERRASEHRLAIQAWHLRKLLPG
jgi:serine/threonine protein kinase